jgi:hypothetical protein
MPTDNGITRSRSGGMSVSLAGPDGRVLGGGLAGLLIASGPVQVNFRNMFHKRKALATLTQKINKSLSNAHYLVHASGRCRKFSSYSQFGEQEQEAEGGA